MSDQSDVESEESEFEADPEDFVDVESSDDGSAFSDASGSDSGSDFGGGSDSDEGDDWDELERKAAKG